MPLTGKKESALRKLTWSAFQRLISYLSENSVVSIINKIGSCCLQEVTCIYSENLIKIIIIAPIIQTGGNTLYIKHGIGPFLQKSCVLPSVTKVRIYER